MIFLRLLAMFWPKATAPHERRQSTPDERAAFEIRRQREEDEREALARRLDYLEAEVSLLANEPHLEKRRT